MYRACPVCHESKDLVSSISRDRIPILQNRVYDTPESAVAASAGRLTLCTCSTCGFSYNGEFDDTLIVYDERYNNDVPSRTFEHYSEQIARSLIAKFNLTSGTVYDIGCGKGTFLRMLCRLAPGIKGIGIDPSCTPVTENNFTLIQDVFRQGSFEADTKLVVLRHVLEHITKPVEFLSELGEAASNIPLYVEVPEVRWIFENGAFWDFCYEHCNYFSAASLKNALQLAGYSDIEQSPSFGGQYQWAIGIAKGAARAVSSHGLEEVAAARRYAHTESIQIEKVQSIVESGKTIAVWGMATKGVMLSCLMGNDKITAGIDINVMKQEKFAPLSGVKIHKPEWLKVNSTDAVLIMNGNYEAEIKAQIYEMGIESTIRTM